MIVAKKWVATGSTATLLAGGLFLGVPAATAAPGDSACLQASVQFNAALNAAGIDVAFVNQLELAVAAVVAAGENLDAVAAALNLEGLFNEQERTAQVAAEAQFLVEQAIVGVDAALAASDPEAYPNPETDPAVIEARQAQAEAEQQEGIAVEAAIQAADAFAAALEDPTLIAADAAFVQATEQADLLVAQVNGDEATAAQLIELFKAFLAACDANAIGVTPVAVPVPVAPVIAPVAPVAPVAAPVTPVVPGAVAAAPSGTNKGLNVQTSVAAEDNGAAGILIAALLAVGVAVPVTVAARLRRLERAQR